MIENDYPIPPSVADVFDKPDGWVEVPQPLSKSILLLPHETTLTGISLRLRDDAPSFLLYEPYSTETVFDR
jgi:hypothetical protein